MEHGADGFPVVVVQLTNLSNDEVLVGYEKGSIEVHCGPYVQYGPFAVDGRRQEVLDARGWIQFPPPRGRWTLRSTRGAELMVPTTLESGDYPLSASFRLTTGDRAVIHSPRQVYSVP